MSVFGTNRPARLIEIVRPAVPPVIDVIFVHGLDGDALRTWGFDEEPSWHSWIAAALPSATIWSLAYGLKSSWWVGGSIPLADRALNLLATLDTELSDSRPIVFVCHSYGGLVVKQLLRTAFETASEYSGLAARVKGIVFLGTPNSGSGLSNYALALKHILRSSTAVHELKRNAPQLRDLNLWFRGWLLRKGVPLRVYFETQNMRGVRVVDESSSDPGVAWVVPIPVDADHSGMTRLVEPDFRVKQTITLIADLVNPPRAEPGRTLMAQLMAAPRDRLPYIRAEIRSRLAADPADREALSAEAYFVQISRHAHLARRASPDRASPPRAMAVRSPLRVGLILMAFPVVATAALFRNSTAVQDIIGVLIRFLHSIL